VNKGFNALVLAGERRFDDPLLEACAKPSKSLIEIGGEPMVTRVLRCLQESQSIDRILLCGPHAEARDQEPRLIAQLEGEGVSWLAPEATPSTSAGAGLSQLGAALPTLLTTADHPLLRPEIVEYFCRESAASGADVTVGLVPYRKVRAIFPTMKKTVLRFRDDEYCGCNLFTFMTVHGRQMTSIWRAVEAERKSPLRVIRLLGWTSVLRYRFGLISLDAALAALSRRTGIRIAAIKLPFGDAGVDVDTVSDRAYVEQRVAQLNTPSTTSI